MKTQRRPSVMLMLAFCCLIASACSSVSNRVPSSKPIRPSNPIIASKHAEVSYIFDTDIFHIEENKKMATSKILKTPFESNFMALYWPNPENFTYENDRNFLLRTSHDKKTWTRWEHISLMSDGKKDNTLYSSMIYTEKAKYFQFKIVRTYFSDIQFKIFTFVFVDSRDSPRKHTRHKEKISATKYGLRLIKRKNWGANERIAWNNEKIVAAPVIDHLFIHHSAQHLKIPHSECDDAVRAHYIYHVQSRKWPDIGHHYLVCQHGYLYQGRRWARNGQDSRSIRAKSLDLLAIGKYVESSDIEREERAALIREAIQKGEMKADDPDTQLAQPTEAMQNKIVDYLYYKVKQYALNPEASDAKLPTILGHRDVGSTQCPGQNLYSLLPNLRSTVAERLREEGISRN